MDPNTVWEGTWPLNLYPKYFLRRHGIYHNIQFLFPGSRPAAGRHRPATRTGRPAGNEPAAAATGRQPHGQRPATGRHPFGMQRGPPAMETSYTILGGWFWSKAFASNMQPSCRRKFRSETSDNMDSWKAEVRRVRRDKIRRKKMQMREKIGKSRFTVFFQWFVAPEGRKVGSLKRRARSQLARWDMKKCTPLWREAHFQVKMDKTLEERTLLA